jgi:hypothetical protein
MEMAVVEFIYQYFHLMVHLDILVVEVQVVMQVILQQVED